MENCLLTTLKGNVEKELPKLGYITIDIKETEGLSNGNFKLKSPTETGDIVVEAGEGGYFATSAAGLDDPSTRLTSYTFSSNFTHTIYVPNLTFKIYVKARYKILTTLEGKTNNIVINLNECDYLTITDSIDFKKAIGSITNCQALKGAKNVQLFNTDISGDTSVFSNNTHLTIVMVSTTNVSGSITNFSKSLSLATVYIGNTAINGNIEDLCEAQIINGRSSGSLTVRTSNNNVKLHNEFTNGDYVISFSDSSCSIALSGNTIATYDGSSWTYL